MKLRCLFTDLDDTLIVTRSGKTFPVDNDDWKFKSGILEAIEAWKPDKLVIVSNQGGIALGYVDMAEFSKKLQTIVAQLESRFGKIVQSMFCHTNDKIDPYRKPNPGMVLVHLPDNRQIEELLMIGDASGKPGQFSDSDKRCAENVRKFGYDCKYLDVDDFIEQMRSL